MLLFADEEEFNNSTFYMLANPHGYTSLGISREELLALDLQTYLFYYEKLCEQRQRESDEYEKLRSKK